MPQETTSLLIAGATGLVGSHCLKHALRDPSIGRVVVISRRELPPELASDDTEGKLEQHIFGFDDLGAHREAIRADAIICALGTTIKKAGTKEQFRRVDHDYPVALARMGKANGARHFLLVSAIGANASSRIFYNRIKGEVEEDIRRVGYRRLTIVRPSVLLGSRTESRPGEAVAQWLARYIPGRYRAVSAEAVAAVLVEEAGEERPGERVMESQEIRRRGGGDAT